MLDLRTKLEKPPRLTCAECGAVVEVANKRSCGHDTATIIANLSAKCYGQSKVSTGGILGVLKKLLGK